MQRITARSSHRFPLILSLGVPPLARPRNIIRPHDWKLSSPVDLAAEVDMYLWDPVLQKPKYGGRSELITLLLRQWLATQRDPEMPVAHEEGSSL